jgi:tRNA-dihydrouridine synthase A
VPPLDYPLVHRLKAERPDLTIVINGGIPDLDVALAQLEHVDGVMLGRAAYHEPGLLGQVDRRVFGEDVADVDAFEAVELYKPYMAAQLAAGVHLAAMSRHMLGLFHGLPGARAWRRILTVEGVAAGAGLDVVDRALAAVRQAVDAREARTLEAIAS